MPGGPGPRSWTTEKPSLEPNMFGKKKKKALKWLLVIFFYTHRSLLKPIVIRGFTQKLIEIDADTHSQMLGGPLEILLRGRGVIRGTRGTKTLWETHSQLPWPHGGSQRLSHWPEYLHEADLVPLHMCCRCVGSSSCGSPGRGSRGCLWLLPALGSPCPTLVT